MRSTRFRLHVGIEGKTGKGNRGRRSGKRERGWLWVCWRVRSDAFLPFTPSSVRARHGAHQHIQYSFLMQYCYYKLLISALIVEYLLNNGVAVPETGQSQAKIKIKIRMSVYFCLNCASTALESLASAGTLRGKPSQLGTDITAGMFGQTWNRTWSSQGQTSYYSNTRPPQWTLPQVHLLP